MIKGQERHAMHSRMLRAEKTNMEPKWKIPVVGAPPATKEEQLLDTACIYLPNSGLTPKTMLFIVLLYHFHSPKERLIYAQQSI